MSENSQTPAPSDPPSGEEDWAPPSPEDLEALLHGYEILELVGQGGMGAVYKARQVSLDRIVAIKLLPPSLWCEDLDFAERFRQEARVMARLMHPGMVAVFDFGHTTDGQLYFVMEFVEGTDVAQMTAARGALPPETARSIAIQVCETLQHAHKNGIIHRDIKPANVMVTKDGKVKVADFGLAKMITQDPDATASETTLGSPDYLAPECLITGYPEDHRVDIYGVGVMLYEMLVGVVPRRNAFPPSNRVRGLDPRYDTVVARAMEYDPEKRYATAAELQQDLVRLGAPGKPLGPHKTGSIASAPVPVPASKGAPRPAAASAPAQAPAHAHPHTHSHPGPPRHYVPPASAPSSIPWAVLGVLLLAIGGGTFFFLRPGKPPAGPAAAISANSDSAEAPVAPVTPVSPVPLPLTPNLPPTVSNGNQAAALELLKWAIQSGGRGVIRTGEQPRDITTLDQLPAPGDWYLSVIDCGYNMVPKETPVPWKLLAEQPRLDGFFYKSEHPLTQSDLARLSANPLLSRLQLDSLDSQDSALEGLPRFAGLRMLRLQRCGMTGACLPILLDKVPQLEQLTLGRVPLTDDQTLHLQKFSKLWELRFMETRLNAQMMNSLTAVPELRNLSFVNCGFDLPSMPALPNVKVLHFFNLAVPKPVRPSFLKSVTGMSTSLRSLTLMRSRLLDEEIADVAALTQLDYLDLSGNPELGAAAVNLATRLPRLNNLVLMDCKGITDTMLQRLAECRQLQRLDLKNTNISDAGLATFKTMPGLRLLQLQGSQVTAAGVDDLRKALPQCRVTL